MKRCGAGVFGSCGHYGTGSCSQRDTIGCVQGTAGTNRLILRVFLINRGCGGGVDLFRIHLERRIVWKPNQWLG